MFLIKNCVYFFSILISLLSIFILVNSIRNKDKKECKMFVITSSIAIIYLFLLNVVVLNALCVEYSLEVLLIALVAFIAVLLYIVSIVINLVRKKKLNNLDDDESNLNAVLIALLIIPVLCVGICIFRDKYYLDNSELILVFDSDGNGGIGDGTTFGYAMNEKYIKRFEIGLDFGGYKLKNYISSDFVEVNEITKFGDYNVVCVPNQYCEDGFIIYKNGEQLFKIKYDDEFINNDFERAFYLNK